MLRFGPAVAARVGEARGTRPQRVDRERPTARSSWRARWAGTIEIRLWILSWGDEVEVLEPASLRDDVAATHARAAGALSGGARLTDAPDAVTGRRLPFAAVNLISDPIHGYLELTKRLAPDESAAAGLPDEDAAEDDLLDTAWLQRLRRISQLQSARWVFPTAEHSRFTHGLGRHARGRPVGARALPSLRAGAAGARRPGEPVPSEGLVVETLRVAGLLHDVGHGPFAHFFDDRVLAALPRARRTPRRPGAQDAVPRGPEPADHRAGARAADPRAAPRAGRRRRSATRFAEGEAIDPRWVSFLVSKPPSSTRRCPPGSGCSSRCCRACSRSTTSTTSGATRTSPACRWGRSTPSGCAATRSSSERGLTLYEPGVGALEMFLTARLFMYQHVYLHRTVRAIDLDLEEVFAALDPSGVRRRLARGAAGRVRRPRRVRAPPPGGAAGRAASTSARAAGRRATGTVTPRRRRRLAGDPAPPAALACRARGPRRVRDRRLARRRCSPSWASRRPGTWSQST